METMSVSDPAAVERSAEILRSGGVILYPTDTLYGLGADALSDDAVDKIYAIKGRDKLKPIHAIVADIAMAQRYGVINDIARKLAEKFLPGPLTLVLKKLEGINSGIARDIGTVGIRIPQNVFCQQLARAFDGLITTTSANLSGAPTLLRVDDILTQFGVSAGNVEFAVDGGLMPQKLPSTVVDVSGGVIKIMREGSISEEMVWSCLH